MYLRNGGLCLGVEVSNMDPFILVVYHVCSWVKVSPFWGIWAIKHNPFWENIPLFETLFLFLDISGHAILIVGHCKFNKAIRDGRPRPPRHQVCWDIVRWECACQISWWSVEKWRRYYILKFHGNTFRWPTTLTFDLKFWKYLSVTEYPYSMCMLSFMMIGWEMTDILHFEILRKHGQTHKQTWALQYLALPLWGAR